MYWCLLVWLPPGDYCGVFVLLPLVLLLELMQGSHQKNNLRGWQASSRLVHGCHYPGSLLYCPV